MKAIQIAKYGEPIEVAKYVEVPDIGAPNASEVVIEVEASPINQYDLLMIAGGYGYRPPLPIIDQSAKPEEITRMFDHLTPLVAAGTITTPVAATFGLDQVSKAITKARESGGKVLFTPLA